MDYEPDRENAEVEKSVKLAQEIKRLFTRYGVWTVQSVAQGKVRICLKDGEPFSFSFENDVDPEEDNEPVMVMSLEKHRNI